MRFSCTETAGRNVFQRETFTLYFEYSSQPLPSAWRLYNSTFPYAFKKLTRYSPLLFPYRPSCGYHLTSALPGKLVDTNSKWANGISPAISERRNGLFARRTGKKTKHASWKMQASALSVVTNASQPFPRRGHKRPRCDGCVWGFVLILPIALTGHMITNYIRERAVMEMNLTVKLHLVFIFDQDDSILNSHQDQSG